MIKVAAFTGGKLVPSARFRVRQYIPELKNKGIELTEFYTDKGRYPPPSYIRRPLWAIGTLLQQIPNIIESYNYDLVLLQREMLSKFYTFESLTKKPRILDVDDAIFMHKDGETAQKLAKISDRIICGNAYLAEWFGKFNKNIVIIPTAVDAEKYSPSSTEELIDRQVVIGWIGTSSNFYNLYSIESVLLKALEINSEAILHIVSDVHPSFALIPKKRYKFIKWNEDEEAKQIQIMDIGLMPLLDNEWTRGKCSFKMLQYMACAKPVISSAVGMNSELFKMGNIGFAPQNYSDWIASITELINNPQLRRSMGQIGRKIVLEKFSIPCVIPKIINAFS